MAVMNAMQHCHVVCVHMPDCLSPCFPHQLCLCVLSPLHCTECGGVQDLPGLLEPVCAGCVLLGVHGACACISFLAA